MKKILSALICFALIFSLCTLSVGAATNYCSLFESNIKSLRWPIEDAGNPDVKEGTAFPTAVIMEYAKMRLGDDHYTDGDQYMKVPAATLEAWAKNNFAIVNVDTLRGYSVNDGDAPDALKWIYFDTATNTYMFLAAGGKGDSTTYKVMGYEKNGSKYTVYSVFFDQAGDEIPAGAVEGKDYIIHKFEDTETKCLIIHSLKTVVETDGTNVKFHSWEKVTSMPSQSELINPTTKVEDPKPVESKPTETTSTPEADDKTLVTVAKIETAVLETEKNVFPENTVVKVEEIVKEEAIKTIETALEQEVERFVAYEITAKCKNVAVQPDGKVKATFNIPSGYDLDRIAVFYVADDGVKEKLTSEVDKATNTVAAELSHFSTYVVAEEKAQSVSEADPVDDDTDPETDIIWIVVSIVAVLLIGGGVTGFIIFKNKKKA